MEYAVEPFFIGLPDYYVYDNNTPLPTAMSFHIGTNKLPQGTHSKAFGIFIKENRKRFNNNISDITAAYRVSKCILYLKAGEKKIFTTQVDFPGYKGRAFDMKNKNIYYFQISLNSPKDLISQYYTKEKRNKKNDYTVFTGQVFSNKVPLIYHMYGQH
ncbi:hypothetical protein [Chryseobacterium sp. Mn2064]|uniref:hypothetical protein n=1 Tax=Chryseobacterium sp. Mn2064 TaxID=3395263 RepID=UPI003BBD8E3C